MRSINEVQKCKSKELWRSSTSDYTSCALCSDIFWSLASIGESVTTELKKTCWWVCVTFPSNSRREKMVVHVADPHFCTEMVDQTTPKGLVHTSSFSAFLYIGGLTPGCGDKKQRRSIFTCVPRRIKYSCKFIYRSLATSLLFRKPRPKKDWLYGKCSLDGRNFASRSIWIAPPWLVAWVIITCSIASDWSALKALLGGGGKEWSKPAFTFKCGNGRTS